MGKNKRMKEYKIYKLLEERDLSDQIPNVEKAVNSLKGIWDGGDAQASKGYSYVLKRVGDKSVKSAVEKVTDYIVSKKLDDCYYNGTVGSRARWFASGFVDIEETLPQSIHEEAFDSLVSTVEGSSITYIDDLSDAYCILGKVIKDEDTLRKKIKKINEMSVVATNLRKCAEEIAIEYIKSKDD